MKIISLDDYNKGMEMRGKLENRTIKLYNHNHREKKDLKINKKSQRPGGQN